MTTVYTKDVRCGYSRTGTGREERGHTIASGALLTNFLAEPFDEGLVPLGLSSELGRLSLSVIWWSIRQPVWHDVM